jgi:hypothetical protein
MSENSPPDGSNRPQSLLSEAVEQAADAATMWVADVARFARSQADLLASGDYGLNDLATAQVGLLRLWVRNSLNAAGVLSDNLALLSYGSEGAAPPPRRFAVAVAVPDGVDLELTPSDLEGQLLRYRIPSSKIRLAPVAVAAQPAAEVTVEVTVDCVGAPNDIYAGELSSADGAVTVPIRVAIDELGRPVQA